MVEHPDIVWCARTGFPLWFPDVMNSRVRCDNCGEVIYGKVYEDRYHEFLCLDCLKSLHEKDGW